MLVVAIVLPLVLPSSSLGSCSHAPKLQRKMANLLDPT